MHATGITGTSVGEYISPRHAAARANHGMRFSKSGMQCGSEHVSCESLISGVLLNQGGHRLTGAHKPPPGGITEESQSEEIA